MRRPLAILKYVPAVLCGLLAVAWVVSLGRVFVVGGHGINLLLNSGSVWIVGDQFAEPLRFKTFVPLIAPPTSLGWLSFWKAFPTHTHYFSLPIPFLLALLLPFSAGPFTRFRFPLWSYFAWTALIAVELAYYVR